jgi:hypothetical protein
MIVDPGKLINHLVNNITHRPIIVNTGNTGGLLRLPCPLHADPDNTLTVALGAETVFRCSNPSCKFRGDAVSLVSLAKEISVKEALKLFGKDGEFADCLPVPLKPDDMDDYLENMESQAALNAYLSKCSQALRRDPGLSGIRGLLVRPNAKGLHPEMGIFLPGDQADIPRCLREFLKPAYKKSALILYPFRRNGEITKIEVRDSTDNSFRRTVVVTNADAGVFGEGAAEYSGRIIATEDPAAAATLYAAYALGSTKPPPIVAFSGYPLPETLRNVTDIDLISIPGATVSTGFLLKTLSVPEVRPGKPPAMRIIEGKTPLGSMTFTSFGTLQCYNGEHVRGIAHMLASRFAEQVVSGHSKAVLDTLAEFQVPAMVRNLIKTEAGVRLTGKNAEAGQKLAAVLDSAQAGEPCNISLANGRVLHCGPDGIFAIRTGGSREAIGNVGLTVDTRVIEGSEEAFECTAVARGGFPAVKVKVFWKDLNADRLRKVVQGAYSELGLSPYVAFYSSSGYSWRDVVSRLAENSPVEKREPLKLKKKVSSNEVKLGKL